MKVDPDDLGETFQDVKDRMMAAPLVPAAGPVMAQFLPQVANRLVVNFTLEELNNVAAVRNNVTHVPRGVALPPFSRLTQLAPHFGVIPNSALLRFLNPDQHEAFWVLSQPGLPAPDRPLDPAAPHLQGRYDLGDGGLLLTHSLANNRHTTRAIVNGMATLTIHDLKFWGPTLQDRVLFNTSPTLVDLELRATNLHNRSFNALQHYAAVFANNYGYTPIG